MLKIKQHKFKAQSKACTQILCSPYVCHCCFGTFPDYLFGYLLFDIFGASDTYYFRWLVLATSISVFHILLFTRPVHIQHESRNLFRDAYCPLKLINIKLWNQAVSLICETKTFLGIFPQNSIRTFVEESATQYTCLILSFWLPELSEQQTPGILKPNYLMLRFACLFVRTRRYNYRFQFQFLTFS